MALYEYECMKCSNRFEVRRSFSDESEVTCPNCQGQSRRIFSPTAVISNGSGFYTTDSIRNETASGSCGNSRGFT